MPPVPKRLTIGIIGGSLSGLFMGLAMRSLGHKVHIFERYGSRRGAGIIVTPPMFDYFQKLKLKRVKNHNNFLFSTRSVSIDKNNNLTIMNHPEKPRPHTSYNKLYDLLLMQYSMRNGSYHFNKQMKSIISNKNNNNNNINNINNTKIIFDDDTEFECDLVIGCDGIGSSVRSQVPGNDSFKLDYAGYIAWRGIIPLNAIKKELNELNPLNSSNINSNEAELGPIAKQTILANKIDEITFNDGGIVFHGENSQFVGYTVPNNSANNVDFLSKEFNWIWYKSINEDLMKKSLIDINGTKHIFSISKGELNKNSKKYLFETTRKELPSLLHELVVKTGNFEPVDDAAAFEIDYERFAFGNINNTDTNTNTDSEAIGTESLRKDNTFLQVVFDGDATKYVTDEEDVKQGKTGRILLAGDAACVVRPHTVQATSKASFDAMTLYDLFIKYGNDMNKIAAEYEKIIKDNNKNIFNESARIGNKTIWPDNGQIRNLKTALDQTEPTRTEN